MSEIPAPPAGLLNGSRDRWKAFWESPAAAKVDRASDMPRLVRWIEQTDEYDRVAKTCRKARLVKGSMGQPVLNPLFSYLNQLEAQISRAESEFGMTPMARRRLEGGSPQPQPEQEASRRDELAKRRAERRRAAGL